MTNPALPGPLEYKYDEDGNLFEIWNEVPSKLNSFAWDAQNRLTMDADDSTGDNWSYRYDAFGRRVGKTENIASHATFYLRDGDQSVAEYDENGSRRVRRHGYAGGFVPAQVAYHDGVGGGEEALRCPLGPSRHP